MRTMRGVWPLAMLLAGLGGAGVARAQSPTAIQRMQLSAFGGVSGVYTGLGGGKNFAVTAGADLALPPVAHLRPVVEVRGTVATDRGLVDSEESAEGGLRVDGLVGHRIHPYGDFLFGRGQMTYGQGYFYNFYEYVLTTTYVYSPGAGVDFDLGDHFGVKVDGQYQRWSNTPTQSGTVWSSVGPVGLVYRFDFNRHGIR